MNRVIKPYWFWLLILAIALTVRLGMGQTVLNPLTPDSKYYIAQAVNLARGWGFSVGEGVNQRPVFEHTPGYALYLAAIYRLTYGSKIPAAANLDTMPVIYSQYLLGILAGWFFATAVWRLTRDKSLTRWYLIGYWFFPPFWFAEQFVLSETWGLLTLSLFTAVSAAPAPDQRWWKLITAGLLLAFTILTRPALIVLLPAWWWWQGWYGGGQVRQKLKAIGWLTAGLIIPVGVWIVRTGVVTGKWLLVQAGVTKVIYEAGCPWDLCHIQYGWLFAGWWGLVIKQWSRWDLWHMWWWYLIKKSRDWLGVPFGPQAWERLGTGSIELVQAVHWWQILVVLMALGGGIWIWRRGLKLVLAPIMIMAGLAAYALIAGDPRYAVPFYPYFLMAAVYGAVAGFRYLRQKPKWRPDQIVIGAIWLVLVLAAGWSLWRPIPGLSTEVKLGFNFFWWGSWALVIAGAALYKYQAPRQNHWLALIYGWWLLLVLIGMWKPMRQVLNPGAPIDDQVWPVSLWFNRQEWD